MSRILSSLIFLSIAFTGCSEFSKTSTGIEYLIHNPENSGGKIEIGQHLELNMRYSTSSDSVLFDTWKTKDTVNIRVTEPVFPGDLMEAFTLMKVGDSATFKIDAQKTFTEFFDVDAPAFVKEGSRLKFDVKINRKFSEAEMQRRFEDMAIDRISNESEYLEKYVKEKGYDVEPTGTGLYVIETKIGTGKMAKPGQKIRVHYTGRLMNGKVFDSSVERNEPIEFTYGSGEVIRGWEQGIGLLKEGSKAIFVIPSHLGYGTPGVSNIVPPNSPLVFEVEFLKAITQ